MGLQIGRRRGANGCAILVVATVLFAVSLFLWLVILPDVERDSRAVEESFAANIAEYEAIPIGEDVVVTGVLAGNESIRADIIAVERDELIRFIDETDEDPSVQWRWDNLEREFPALTLAIEGGVVQTAGGGRFTWRGEGLETVENGPPSDEPERYLYAGQNLTHGATRTFSLRNGDRVTLLGSKTESGSIQVRDLYAGEREGLAGLIEQSNQVLRFIALIFLGGAVLALVGGSLSILRGRL